MKRPGPTDDWVVVAAYQSTEADLEADLAVALLEGSEIPVVRLPVQPMSTLARGCLGMIQPIRILVPPEWEQTAVELLQGEAEMAADSSGDEAGDETREGGEDEAEGRQGRGGDE